MHSNIRIAPLLLLAVMLGLPALFLSAHTTATHAAGELQEPHDFRAYGMDCRSCHKVVGLKKSGGLVKPIREICHGCHTLEGLLSHPVDIKPSFALPADLPLDERGMMTCTTCHNPHKLNKNSLTGKKTMYLRREGPQKIFCMACHSKA